MKFESYMTRWFTILLLLRCSVLHIDFISLSLCKITIHRGCVRVYDVSMNKKTNQKVSLSISRVNYIYRALFPAPNSSIPKTNRVCFYFFANIVIFAVRSRVSLRSLGNFQIDKFQEQNKKQINPVPTRTFIRVILSPGTIEFTPDKPDK